MKILLDECVPRPLRRELIGHEVRTVADMRWEGIKNGALLRLAALQFDVFLTVDRHIPEQQNMRGFQLALVLLLVPDNKLHSLSPLVPDMLAALTTIQPGDMVRITA